jgi:hypothetical protein
MAPSVSKPSLAEALESFATPRIGVECSTCAFLKTMPESDSKALREALSNKDLSHAAITRALNASGYKLSSGALARHRRGDCKTV